ncbi:MAG TPA: cupin domain-containing protein, partial [Solirubrobacteraceae bacterium]|nr:cupin domain-containing protein [Solirubrobacteraceae bacterium]
PQCGGLPGMANFTRLNLRDDVEDMAPRFGYAPHAESRFARKPLGLEQSGVSFFRLAPGFRFPFGHRHGEQEEVYVVASGSVRMKVDDEIVELNAWDAIRVPASSTRCPEAGPNGAELIVVGAPLTESNDAELIQDWWTD